ncbi:hypothetical protein E2562_027711 [Oryza meyeriana var. granulata]|uniref:Uncharacterized protein n=1 Tax=Oryza meyeriana var. granulata TaxID=110450 RepID=A0A6G1CTC2_9ORYZ|nr:hypothetical protein E2562_027711 [Oryza meyeriana var. granulata]
MMEGGSNMQPHLGSESIAAVDGGQPETELVEINSSTTPELGNDRQMADEVADIESQQDGEMVDIEAQDSCNGSSMSAPLNNHEARIKIDFEFLWRL